MRWVVGGFIAFAFLEATLAYSMFTLPGVRSWVGGFTMVLALPCAAYWGYRKFFGG